MALPDHHKHFHQELPGLYTVEDLRCIEDQAKQNVDL
jgi:hypothetical protein